MKAKFICTRKSGIETFTVVLTPVNDVDDRSFFKDTPHGEIAIYPVTKEAGALFAEGQEITIDFG